MSSVYHKALMNFKDCCLTGINIYKGVKVFYKV